MTKPRHLLLLDRSGESKLDIYILLQVVGYQVELFKDDLIAVNKYRLMLETDHSFDLVIVIEGAKKAELDMNQLVECFTQLVLFRMENAQINLLNSSGECLLGWHLENLPSVVANELAGDEKKSSL